MVLMNVCAAAVVGAGLDFGKGNHFSKKMGEMGLEADRK